MTAGGVPVLHWAAVTVRVLLVVAAAALFAVGCLARHGGNGEVAVQAFGWATVCATTALMLRVVTS